MEMMSAYFKNVLARRAENSNENTKKNSTLSVCSSTMVTKHQRAAAARARAARWPKTYNSNTVPAASNPAAVIEIDYNSSSEQDCGYTGGVDCQFSDTKYDSATESEWSDGLMQAQEESS